MKGHQRSEPRHLGTRVVWRLPWVRPIPMAAVRIHAAVHWAIQAWTSVKTVIPDCPLHVPETCACTHPARRRSCCICVRNPRPPVLKPLLSLFPLELESVRRPCGDARRSINPLALTQTPRCSALVCSHQCGPHGPAAFRWQLVEIILHPLARRRINHKRLLEALVPLVDLGGRTGWRLWQRWWWI